MIKASLTVCLHKLFLWQWEFYTAEKSMTLLGDVKQTLEWILALVSDERDMMNHMQIHQTFLTVNNINFITVVHSTDTPPRWRLHLNNNTYLIPIKSCVLLMFRDKGFFYIYCLLVLFFCWKLLKKCIPVNISLWEEPVWEMHVINLT